MSENNGIQNGTTEPQATPNPSEGAPQTVQVPAPTFGFTEKGTFFLEVDVRLGFLTILGCLTRAISFINGAFNQQEAKMREQEKQKSLLKPKTGFGKFNLFK